MPCKEISDLYLTSFLLERGYSLRETKRLGNRLLWVFDNSDSKIDDDIRSYYEGKALVNPLRFVECIRSQKNYIFSNDSH